MDSNSNVLDRNRQLLNEADHHLYKVVGPLSLEAYIYHGLATVAGTEPTAAMIFFAGSNWDQAQISQFAPHCMYFASRGVTSILAEYRTSHRHQGSPEEAMEDARDAVAWIRMNAEALNVDPKRIVTVGASAGGHIAMASAMWPVPAKKALPLDTAPNAVVLFNPILDTTRKGFEQAKFADPVAAKTASPIHHLRKGLPPTLILHGTNDRAVPFMTSKKFQGKMKWKNNECTLVPFEGQGHGFFNFNVDARLYELSLNEIDRFLVNLGWTKPAPEITDTVRLAAM
jgi:acetyl esterase